MSEANTFLYSVFNIIYSLICKGMIKMRRSGLITRKIGMTRLFDDAGVARGVTVLSVGDCSVIGNRTR